MWELAVKWMAKSQRQGGSVDLRQKNDEEFSSEQQKHTGREVRVRKPVKSLTKWFRLAAEK